LLDFLQQTVVEASADYMNASTRPGFDVIEVYVKPKNPEDMEQPWIYDPNFTREVWDLQQDLGKLPEVREVYSILSAVAKVSQETFGKDFPETREEVAAIFMMELENSIASEVLEQFYHENGFRLSVTTAVDYSPDVRALTDAILKTRENRPSIQIFPFGNVVKYAQLDNYIVKGKPWNILTSQGVVVLLSASWIFFSLKGFGANRAWTALKAGLAMSSPFVFSSAMIILVMMALGVPLDIATSSIGAIAINASIDFSIYWTAVYIKLRISGASHNEALERTMKQEGRIVVGDAVLNIIVFCPLRISIFLPIARLGWIMVLMLTFAAIGALVIMPPLLKWAFGK